MSARVARRAAPRRRAQVLGALLELAGAAALLASLGVFQVWSRTRVVEAGYALADLQQEHARLVAAQDQLEIERSMLTSFDALDRAAHKQLSALGLAPPDRGAVWAAGPDRPDAGPGRAGVDGVGHRPRPAGPIVGSSPSGPATAGRAARPAGRTPRTGEEEPLAWRLPGQER
ncbi:MAG TPA: hypothetical protein VFG59_08700 [Anaeromyxobacter sp.]|nr:hypothetical protein [Anaeromyxobacter sp.]